MSHVFISYKHGDFEKSSFLETLEERIKSENIEVWRDSRIQAGDNWEREIDIAIDNCSILLLLLSENVTESQYVTYEWTRALTLGKPVIPVRLSTLSKLHPRLEKTQFIDFTASHEQAWLELIARIIALHTDYVANQERQLLETDNEKRRMFNILQALYASRITPVTAEDIITKLSFEQFLSAKDYARIIDMSRKNQQSNL